MNASKFYLASFFYCCTTVKHVAFRPAYNAEKADITCPKLLGLHPAIVDATRVCITKKDAFLVGALCHLRA